MLRQGARGAQVRILQTALNLWPQHRLPRLIEDGIFGPKTDGSVRAYQRGHKLVADGIVGPLTWGALEALLRVIVALDQPPVGGLTEAQIRALGDRIITAAEWALGHWGWPTPTVTRDKALPYIAAAYCADPSDPARPRQGGAGLATIFQGAGVSCTRCRTITPQAEAMWQQQTTAGAVWRNQHDLVSWCGIFCYFVYAVAGVRLGGWHAHAANISTGRLGHVGDHTHAFRGCIGNITRGNHFFLVSANQAEQARLETIDGNAWGPEFPDRLNLGCRSVIRRRSYTYADLKTQNARFYFPGTWASGV